MQDFLLALTLFTSTGWGKVPDENIPIKVEIRKSGDVQFILLYWYSISWTGLSKRALNEMRQMIEQESNKQYVIRSNTISSVDKALSSDKFLY